jgi:polar amino acid transport system substrate-binding protein
LFAALLAVPIVAHLAFHAITAHAAPLDTIAKAGAPTISASQDRPLFGPVASGTKPQSSHR